LADAATLQYLEYLNGDDKSSEFIKKRVSFWAGLIRQHAIVLPRSVEFFRASFPEVSLDPPPKAG
jgi:hypothetical protein